MPPNVLMIVTHDTGRHTGPYNRGVATPSLNRLAREGVVFTQAFCAAPQCSPSRASLLTGLAPHSHGLVGLTHRGFSLHDDSYARTLPALLREAGYATHLFGLQHEAPDPHVLGYTHVTQPDGRPRHACQQVAPAVVDFLGSQPTQPFFAMVGFFETHRPFTLTETPLDGLQPPPYLPDDPIVRRDVADLNAQVRQADAAIGQILDAIDRAGLGEETLVIVTTDHGVAFPGAKGSLFDPGIEIGLLMRGPDHARGGRRIPALVSNVDLQPTVLDLCGLRPPAATQGVSLRPLIRGKAEHVRAEVFAELTYHTTYDPMRAIRTSRYKYIHSFAERPMSLPAHVDPSPTKDLLRDQGYFDQPRPAEMLFDLMTDPLERHNLIAEPVYAGTLTGLRARLESWMTTTGDPLLHGDAPAPPDATVTPVNSYDP